MTLGGLALAVGILVDDATVTIENIERYLEEGNELHEAILDGAAQIAVPALVSTLCICIVFLPMFFLSGVARYLFVPLAEAVVFAMLASYVLSRTLVPTLAHVPAASRSASAAPSRNPLVLLQRAFERGFERLRAGLSRAAGGAGAPRASCSSRSFSASCLSAFLLLPVARRRISSPAPTAASSCCTCAPRPARASRRRRGSATWWRTSIRAEIPREELETITRQHRPALQQHQHHAQNLRRRSAPRTPTSWCR